jgi:hypothetical protein
LEIALLVPDYLSEMPMATFAEIVAAADKLSADEQQTLLEILGRRIALRRRAELAGEVQQARDEFARGESRSATVRQIMDEVSRES